MEYIRGIPDYDYEIGTLTFIRGKPKKLDSVGEDDMDASNGFEAFKGEGQSLRNAKNKK